jgi:hypothetical protein
MSKMIVSLFIVFLRRAFSCKQSAEPRQVYRPYGFAFGCPATPWAAPSLNELGTRLTPPTPWPTWFAPLLALSVVDAQPQANSSPTAAIVEINILIMTILL